MAEVRAREVSKLFRAKRTIVEAVKSVSVDIQDGEFVVFVGPSGSGKTTFLRLVAGLEIPTSGQIYIGEREVTTMHPRARGVAMVFQDYALYPHMTVRENMSFALENLKYPRKEIERRVGEVGEMLRIGELLDRRPRELSGGQRQRVALGRAVVRQPQAFLFDEPLSNLDAKLRVQMRVELAELHRRLGTTSLYVTHDQVEAMTLGQRIFVMNGGVIQQCASATELYDYPANIFVASFIGSPAMNMVPAGLERDERGLAIMIDGQRLPVPGQLVSQYEPYSGRKVIFGMRPEHIASAEDETSFKPGCTYAGVRLILVENLGIEKLVYFGIGDQQLVARIPVDVPLSDGTESRLVFNMNKTRLFDPVTGVALHTA